MLERLRAFEGADQVGLFEQGSRRSATAKLFDAARDWLAGTRSLLFG